MSKASEVAARASPASALGHLPVGLFAAVMALAGLGIAWQRAAVVFGTAAWLGEAIITLAACVFVVIAAFYWRKLLRHPGAVGAEFRHPVTLPLFSMPTIGLILLGSGILPYAPAIAEPVWYAGAVGTLVLMLGIVGGWLAMRPDIRMANPSWFVPVICNALTPVAGMPLGHDIVAWVAFVAASAIGAVVFVLVCYRLLAHERLPVPLLPTLVILMAPTALEFSGYVALNGGAIDAVASLLYYATLVMVGIVVLLIPLLADVPFGPSWWSFTFPLDAAAIAALQYDAAVGGLVPHLVAAALLAAATAVIALVGLRTIVACARGTFLTPHGTLR